MIFLLHPLLGRQNLPRPFPSLILNSFSASRSITLTGHQRMHRSLCSCIVPKLPFRRPSNAAFLSNMCNEVRAKQDKISPKQMVHTQVIPLQREDKNINIHNAVVRSAPVQPPKNQKQRSSPRSVHPILYSDAYEKAVMYIGAVNSCNRVASNIAIPG